MNLWETLKLTNSVLNSLWFKVLGDTVLTEKPLQIRHRMERGDEAISPIPEAALKFNVRLMS